MQKKFNFGLIVSVLLVFLVFEVHLWGVLEENGGRGVGGGGGWVADCRREGGADGVWGASLADLIWRCPLSVFTSSLLIFPFSLLIFTSSVSGWTEREVGNAEREAVRIRGEEVWTEREVGNTEREAVRAKWGKVGIKGGGGWSKRGLFWIKRELFWIKWEEVRIKRELVGIKRGLIGIKWEEVFTERGLINGDWAKK